MAIINVIAWEMSASLSSAVSGGDAARDALLRTSDRWFHWLIVSTVILSVGCIMEIGETIVEGLHWFWHRRKKPFQEDETRWTIPLSVAGVILVIVGVAGEGICEAKQASAETAIREYDEHRLAGAIVEASAANERSKTLGLSTQGLITKADTAKRDLVAAQLELARLTGPPYLVPVIHGVATPDISKGDKQHVLLTADTRINLPTLPKDKSFSWTLSLIQDEVGQHHFTFSPDIGGFDPNVYNAPLTGWLVSLQTDSSGTRKTGMGASYIAAPNPNTKAKQ